jgi:hypothetical protein
MSRKLFAFLLSELNKVCVICRACGVKVELPIAELGAKYQGMGCPFCGAALMPKNSTNVNAFVNLSHAIGQFQEFANSVQIEFILPDNDK